MKTLIIFSDLGETNLNYLIVEGDYSRFNGAALNLNNHKYCDEFREFMYGEDGFYKHEFSEDIQLIQNKEWDIVIHCFAV